MRKLTVNLPDDEWTVELSSDTGTMYEQLVCWCLIQRFWYYVYDRPKVSDREYDEIEQEVKDLEDIYGFTNKYSPSSTIGSEHIRHYPRSIRFMFGFCGDPDEEENRFRIRQQSSRQTRKGNGTHRNKKARS